MLFGLAFVAGSVLTLFLAAGVFQRGRAFGATAKRIGDSEATPVARVSPGFVEVKGKAKASGALLTSPLSRTPCVYYRFQVEQRVRRGRSTVWREVLTDEQECGLLLEDAHQSSIAVNVRAADVILAPDTRARSGFLNDAPPELEETLRRYGGSSRGLVFNKTMRYTETVLREGDPLHVLGTARSQDGRLVIDRGEDLFIVSDKSEEQLIQFFRRKRLAHTAGAAGIALFSLAMMGVAAAIVMR